MTASATDPGAAKPSTPELVSRFSRQASRLLHDELELAKAEMATKSKRLGVGAGALGTSGVVALLGVAVLLAAAVLGLAQAMPAWAAALCVGGALLLIAGVAAAVGLSSVKRGTPPFPEEAIADLRIDLTAVKGGAHR